jgi:hypothetical protein
VRYEALAHNFATWLTTATQVEIELILGLLGAELVARGGAGSVECFTAQRALKFAREIDLQQENAGNN